MQLLLFVLAWTPTPALQEPGPAFSARPGELEFSGRMIVRPVRTPEVRARALARLAPHVLRHFEQPDFLLVRVPQGHDENSFAAELLRSGEFEYAHPDWICAPIGNTPNDPSFGQQWHHRVMQSEFAWEVTTGDPSYVAAFVDTGVDLNHPDLTTALVSGYNSADRLAQSSGGQVNDINGHGTAVAGCIGAIGNNGIGVAGVNWNVKLMPIRTTNQSNGNASLSDLLDGALWAVNHGARSVSLSYSGVEASAVGTTGDTIDGLGGVMLWAAGNSATNLSWFDWSNVVVVGASNNGDHKTSWSSYGRAVDTFAPGEFIVTTARGGGVTSASGTSFSTPLTNGAVALIWAAHPAWTNDEVLDKLFSSCVDLGAIGEDDVYGHGRVDVGYALDAPGLPPRLFLDMTYPYAGQDWTLTLSRATPGGTAHFFYARQFGTTPWPQLDVDLGLVNPIEFGSAPVNALGVATYTVFLPASYARRRAWVQAAEFGAVSGLILVIVD